MRKSAYPMAAVACLMLVFSLVVPEVAGAEEGQPSPRPRQELKEGKMPPNLPFGAKGLVWPGPETKGGQGSDDTKSVMIHFWKDKPIETPPVGEFRLYSDDESIMVDANEAEFGQVLKAVGEKSGIKVLVGDDVKGRKERKVVEGKPEEVIERLAGKNFYAFTYGEDGKVKEAVIGNVPGAAVEYRRIVIPYGDGPGEVGRGCCGEDGPSGFTVDGNGTIYILDNINKRVQIFDNDGNLVEYVAIEEAFGEDIMVDKEYMYIYAYGTPSTLTQYGRTGKIVNRLHYNSGHNPAGMPSFIWEGGVYVWLEFRSVSQLPLGGAYELIAKVERGVLRNSKFEDENRYIRGVMGRSGKIYSDGIAYNDEYKIALKDSPEEEEITSLVKDMRTISRRELHSLHPLGDDDEGNIYYSVYRDSRTEMLVFGGNSKIKLRFIIRNYGRGKTEEVGKNHTIYTLSRDKQCVINIYKMR